MPCTSSSTNRAGHPWPCAGHPRLCLRHERRGWPRQAHGCPARFVLSCCLLEWDASARGATTVRGAPRERLELEFGLRRFARGGGGEGTIGDGTSLHEVWGGKRREGGRGLCGSGGV